MQKQNQLIDWQRGSVNLTAGVLGKMIRWKVGFGNQILKLELIQNLYFMTEQNK